MPGRRRGWAPRPRPGPARTPRGRSRSRRPRARAISSRRAVEAEGGELVRRRGRRRARARPTCWRAASARRRGPGACSVCERRLREQRQHRVALPARRGATLSPSSRPRCRAASPGPATSSRSRRPSTRQREDPPAQAVGERVGVALHEAGSASVCSVRESWLLSAPTSAREAHDAEPVARRARASPSAARTSSAARQSLRCRGSCDLHRVAELDRAALDELDELLLDRLVQRRALVRSPAARASARLAAGGVVERSRRASSGRSSPSSRPSAARSIRGSAPACARRRRSGRRGRPRRGRRRRGSSSSISIGVNWCSSRSSSSQSATNFSKRRDEAALEPARRLPARRWRRPGTPPAACSSPRSRPGSRPPGSRSACRRPSARAVRGGARSARTRSSPNADSGPPNAGRARLHVGAGEERAHHAGRPGPDELHERDARQHLDGLLHERGGHGHRRHRAHQQERRDDHRLPRARRRRRCPRACGRRSAAAS